MSIVIENQKLRQALGANLRRLRKAAGVTQENLAEKIGISAVHLNRIEKGHSSPSAEVLFALADSLNVTADNLRQLPTESRLTKSKA